MVALPDITSPTLDAIEAAVVAAEALNPRRGYIGGSSIGNPCERHLFYQFRMAHEPEQFSGRMLRLFDTGHAEEVRMIAWLRMAGVDVQDVDPETGDQWEVEALEGHFKGHLDGILTGLLEAPKTPHLLECKTHNAKSFAQLKKHGVAVAKPEHVAQMQVYMHLKSLTRAVYLAKNKDTDELYLERIHYDQAHALQLLAKAERIRDANYAPERIGDADSFACKFCASHSLCHGGAPALRNCRTCIHASAQCEGDGQWFCARHDRDLTVEDQRAGCPNHLYIPSLVNGEQIDANETAETVTYRMADGSEWVDGQERTAA